MTGAERKEAREARLAKRAALLHSELARLTFREIGLGPAEREAVLLAEIRAVADEERDEVGKLFDADYDAEVREAREQGALGMRLRAAREAESWHVDLGKTAYDIGNAIRALPLEVVKR